MSASSTSAVFPPVYTLTTTQYTAGWTFGPPTDSSRPTSSSSSSSSSSSFSTNPNYGPSMSSSSSLSSSTHTEYRSTLSSSTLQSSATAAGYIAGNDTLSGAPDTAVEPASAAAAGPPLPVIVGAVVASIILVVAVIVGWMWIRRRRSKGERQDARYMRELGRERGGAWLFERGVAPRMARLGSESGTPSSPAPTYASEPPPALSRPLIARPRSDLSASASESAWADDSELDMMATDGSSLARTLSTRSTLSTTSTIRTLASPTDRERIDHPGYTYRSTTSASRSRSTPATTPASTLLPGSMPVAYLAAGISPSSRISPFADPSPTSTTSTSTSTLSTSISPITRAPSQPPRPASRLSTLTVSSENPFVDPLPAYTEESIDVDRVQPYATRPQLPRIDTSLQRPPPAYRELPRGGR